MTWAVLALGAGEARAQDARAGELRGRVIDAETGAPIEAALVEVESPTDVAVSRAMVRPPPALSGADGLFRLGPLEEGVVVLRVSHIGYGAHRNPLRIEGDGSGFVEISLSPTAIHLEPLLVEARASTGLGGLGSPSSRNVIRRDAIAAAAASGVSVGDFLSREVSGMHVRRSAQAGGPVCLEFRGARRADGPCRPPQVYVDGIAVPSALDFFGYYSLDGLEQIHVVSPSEAGTRFGPNSGWGVLLLETRRTGRDPVAPVPVVRRSLDAPEVVDWSIETRGYPWARVYAGAFVGNALGLAAGSLALSQCMDLDRRRFYRGPDACGAGLLLASGMVMAVLPPLGGSFGARHAGSTPRTRGKLGTSFLYSLPVFVPGFALASVSAGGGFGGVDILGLVLVVVGAPVLNTFADYTFRERR